MDKSDVQAARENLATCWAEATTELDAYLAQREEVLVKLRARKVALSKQVSAMRPLFLLHGLEPIKLRKDPVQDPQPEADPEPEAVAKPKPSAERSPRTSPRKK